MPEYTYVTDVYASPRDANTVFVTLNNWLRGDYKPYIVRSTDRGRTWTSIAGDLPQRSGVWSIVQDDVNAEPAVRRHGVRRVLHRRRRRALGAAKGGIPTAQARDIAIQRRENDLVVGTFGRGVYVLDDYTALRDITPQTLAEDARLYPAARRVSVRHARTGRGDVGRSDDAEPAVWRGVHLQRRAGAAGDAKLVLTIADDTGKQVRRLDLAKDAGVHRIAWDLRGEHRRRRRSGRRRAVHAGTRGAATQQEAASAAADRQGGPPAAAGRYRATIGKLTGDTVTPIGQPQSFSSCRSQK